MRINDKINEWINNNKYKKIIYNFVIIIIICVIVLIVWDVFFPQEPKSNTDTQNAKKTVLDEKVDWRKDYHNSQEDKLKNILSQMKGVGEVDVMITYESSSEVVPAANVQKSRQMTEEKDSQGGTRKTTQEDLTENVVTSSDHSELVVIKEIKPEIRGVVIVAEGAGNIEVKSRIIEAVQIVFQIPSSKVMVYEKNPL